MQRLDVELTRRGELYRNHGLNDLASYRALFDGGAKLPPMPRVMLIVDEFQEFFVEDDKVAQESALLMDRLVRQGRAFGVHVLLGSQTLGGAFSLARSTIDQMAVRIALQCSEADAHLILSRENTEARLLSRPGEGIYNPMHGLLEGNHLFQVVWLNDDKRDEILTSMKLNRTEAVGFARRVLAATEVITDEYVKEVNVGQMVIWAVRELYNYVEEKVPEGVEKQLKLARGLNEKNLELLLAAGRILRPWFRESELPPRVLPAGVGPAR